MSRRVAPSKKAVYSSHKPFSVSIILLTVPRLLERDALGKLTVGLAVAEMPREPLARISQLGFMVTAYSIPAVKALALGSTRYQQLSVLTRDDPSRSPAWQRAWYLAFGDIDHDPVVLVEDEGARLCGFLALHWAKPRFIGDPVRRLRSTTNGHSAYTALSVSPRRPEVLHSLLDAGALLPWDQMELVAVQAPLAERVAEWARSRGLIAQLGGKRSTPVFSFNRTGSNRSPTSGFPARSPQTRSRERALERQGTLVLEVVNIPTDLRHALEEYLEAESRSWKAGSGELLTADPFITRFYRELVEAADDRTRPVIHFLRLDGNVIAARFSVLKDGMLVANKTFFDDALRRSAPGIILEHRFLEAVAENPAVDHIDFYTRMQHYDAFANRHEDFQNIRVWKKTLTGRAAYVADRITAKLQPIAGQLRRRIRGLRQGENN